MDLDWYALDANWLLKNNDRVIRNLNTAISGRLLLALDVPATSPRVLFTGGCYGIEHAGLVFESQLHRLFLVTFAADPKPLTPPALGFRFVTFDPALFACDATSGASAVNHHMATR